MEKEKLDIEIEKPENFYYLLEKHKKTKKTKKEKEKIFDLEKIPNTKLLYWY